MGDGPNDGKRFSLIALGAVWLMSFIYAFFAFTAAPMDTVSDARTNPEAYLGWQGVAGIAAVAIYGVGLAWERGSATRRLSLVPLLLAFLQALAIFGIFLWAHWS